MAHNATEHHTRVLEDFLCKSAEDTETNLEESTVGVNPDQQPDFEGRAAGSMEAPWGERPSPKSDTQDSVHHSDAVLQGIEQSRQRMLEELFDSKGPASKAEQALVGQQLSHGASGDYESSSCLLNKSAGEHTLSERTRGLLG